MFRLDNFLNTHPRIVLVFGVLLTIAAVFLKRKWKLAFLILYILFIALMTIAYRETGVHKGQFVLFSNLAMFFTSRSMRQDLLNNIWLFVPLGAILSGYGRHSWVWGAALSILIEASQYIFSIGLADLGDVICNCLGVLIGYGTAYACTGLLKSTKRAGIKRTRAET